MEAGNPGLLDVSTLVSTTGPLFPALRGHLGPIEVLVY